MAAQAFVIVHDNPFNKSVVSENTLSFNNKEELKLIFEEDSLLKQREEIARENLKIINSRYRWDLIVEKYEKYFLKILADKKI
jgi:glycosyltransferase involved in cell wall biosynthesis